MKNSAMRARKKELSRGKSREAMSLMMEGIWMSCQVTCKHVLKS
jgi:hypothetical protein